jgi:hypothetical protein
MTEFLTASVHHLQVLSPTFSHYYITSEDSVPGTSEDETIDLAQLVCPILDFVAAMTRHGKVKEWLQSNLHQIVTAVFNYAQMTQDDVRNSLFVVIPPC